jgi:hypothetical protein
MLASTRRSCGWMVAVETPCQGAGFSVQQLCLGWNGTRRGFRFFRMQVPGWLDNTGGEHVGSFLHNAVANIGDVHAQPHGGGAA